jgi:Recombinase zinc beta ribbon domain
VSMPVGWNEVREPPESWTLLTLPRRLDRLQADPWKDYWRSAQTISAAFAGLLTCARCGCAFTGETKKGQYIYYHCTGHRGPCGYTYLREAELARLFGELVKQVRIPTELADTVARILRGSQSDKEQFARTTMLRLQQQQLFIRMKLDRAYDDRLGRRISDELWTSKSAELEGELEAELQKVRAVMARHEHASHPACPSAAPRRALHLKSSVVPAALLG